MNNYSYFEKLILGQIHSKPPKSISIALPIYLGDRI